MSLTMNYSGERLRRFAKKVAEVLAPRDTGWRQVTLLNGYRGSLSIRRIDKTVYLKGEVSPPIGATTFNGIFYNTTAGFQNGTPWIFFPVKSNGSAALFTVYRKAAEIVFDGSPAATDAHTTRFEISWLVGDSQAWPTILPGTAIDQN